MIKKTLSPLYESYIIHKMQQFQRDINKTYATLEEGEDNNKYRKNYANDWHQAVQIFIKNMETPKISLGKIDSEHYSDKYAYKQIPNTKSTALFLVEENHIFLARIDLSIRQWPRLLKETAGDLDKEIGNLRQHLKAQKEVEKTAPKGKIILPASKDGKGSGKNKPPAPEKSQQQDKDDHNK